MRDLDIHDIRIRARMHKAGLITEQELINAVEALLQQTHVMRGGTPEPLPLPWTFVWDRAPMLIASNGATVCVLSTGTIDGPYYEDDIRATAALLCSGNGA